jgi:ABC-type nitrate/sulfonate/bicarbonate transport system substrate-binding protein
LDLGKAPISYQGLSTVAARSYLRKNPSVVDAIMRAIADSVAYVQTPSAKETVVQSLKQNLRLTNDRSAENAYQALQWLYGLDMRPNLESIENTRRILVKHNPMVKRIRTEDVIEAGPLQRLESSRFYTGLLARARG